MDYLTSYIEMIPAINFNHIDDDLSESDIRMLTQLYLTYHNRCWCYRKMFRSLKRKDLALHVTSARLGAVGATVRVFVNLIALNVVRLGAVLHAVTLKKNYPKKVEACQFAYTCYQKELSTLKGCLQGKEFHKDILLLELNRLDDLVTDMCLPTLDELSRNYYKKFKVDFPGPCSDVATPPVVHETLI